MKTIQSCAKNALYRAHRRGCGAAARWFEGGEIPAPLDRRGGIARASIYVLLLPRLAAPALADAPFSFDAAPGRLPKNVVPQDYDIALVPDIAAHTVRGTEAIILKVRSATAMLTFNSLNETLDHVLFDGRPVSAVESDDEAQLTKVTLAKPAAPGLHRLTLSYNGKIESQPFGIYTQSFTRPDGMTDSLLSTKFEPTFARRMFPCWDEPAFRATFGVSLTVAATWATIGNMPIDKRTVNGALATTSFRRTPKMPTYLVELTAGDFAEVSTSVGKTGLGVWAVRGQEQDGATALANARQILADYNDYFGYPFPLPKLDSIATPGGFSGAMENWGAITYNDQSLLITPSSSIRNRQDVFFVQAHEMAHQWNGDLVTMGWWDDLWLNESFASFRAANEVALRHPDWLWWEVEDAGKEGAMGADARQASHAIEQHVANELQARGAFDPQITYAKGEAVLRMLEAYVGPEKFRDGIRSYMKAHAFSNASTADLWLALDAASGRKVSEVAADWTGQPGYPLVTATTLCDASGNRSVTLAQRRFLLEGEDPGHSHWRVPMRVRAGIAAVPQPVLFTDDGQKVEAGRCDQPLSLTPDAIGFYRVAYDDKTLETDRLAFPGLPSGDRIALLDDQWALVQAGQQKLDRYLGLASAMGADLNDRAWSQIIEALGQIETYERGTAGHDAFTAYARSILRPVAAALGWDPRQTDSASLLHLRREVIRQLGEWNEADIVAEATRRFDAYLSNPATLSPDDQAMVLSIIATNADQAVFDKLHGLLRSAHNETELDRYLRALMRVRDPILAQQALDVALSKEIPPQADVIRMPLIFSAADQNPALAWAAFRDHVEQIMAPHPQYRPLWLAQYVPEFLWNAVPPDELEAWLKVRVPPEMAPNLARGMQTARFKLSRKAQMVAAADAYLASRTVSAKMTIRVQSIS
jgi:aminopeptidase N